MHATAMAHAYGPRHDARKAAKCRSRGTAITMKSFKQKEKKSQIIKNTNDLKCVGISIYASSLCKYGNRCGISISLRLDGHGASQARKKRASRRRLIFADVHLSSRHKNS